MAVFHQVTEGSLHLRGRSAERYYQLLGLAGIGVTLDFAGDLRPGSIGVLLHAPAGCQRTCVGIVVDRHDLALIGIEREAGGQLIDVHLFGLTGNRFIDPDLVGLARVGNQLPGDVRSGSGLLGECQALDEVVGAVTQCRELLRSEAQRVAIGVHVVDGAEDQVVELLVIERQVSADIYGTIFRHVNLLAELVDGLRGHPVHAFRDATRDGVRRVDLADIDRAAGVGLVVTEHTVAGLTGHQGTGIVQRALQQHAGAGDRDLVADQSGIGLLDHRGGVGGLDPDGALADVDDGAAQIGVARLAGRGIVEHHIAGSGNDQVAVFQQDRRVDIDRAAVIALGIRISVAGVVVGRDGADSTAGEQTQAVIVVRTVGSYDGRDDGRIDIDTIGGSDIHIAGLEALCNHTSGNGTLAIAIAIARAIGIGVLDIDHCRIEQPGTRLLAAAGIDLGIGSNSQALAGSLDHAALLAALGAG
ncbi:hypothetical protein D3C81_1150590 [compost metagenome]